jgi:uncharacterized protein (DUF362 family)
MTLNQGPIDAMVHLAVRELTGFSDTAQAWLSLFPGISAASKIGIKINLACGDVPTHPEVINAIIDGLLMMDLGGQTLPEEHIIVYDHDHPFFCPQTGYTPNWGGPGVQYVGSSHGSVGYDLDFTFTLSHPLGATTNHHPSSLITQHFDYMINAAVIKDHSDSDVTLCLKNHYGSFDGVSVFPLHVHYLYGDGHTRGEPGLNKILRDDLGDKTKLFLIDATLGLYDGGPGYTPPGHTPPNWVYNSVIVGTDPVAVDRISTIKINEERTKPAHGLAPLDPSHVTAAAQPPYELGIDNPALITIVELDAAVVGVRETLTGPESAALLAPYPNPTTSGSTFRFNCPGTATAELILVDIAGRRVRRLAAGQFPHGIHSVVWDGRDDGGRPLPSGVYFCQLMLNGKAHHRRVVRIR